MSLHQPKVKIKQPDGITYMIQEYHYSKELAQEYINMLITRSNIYIKRKTNGEFIASMLSVQQLEEQLRNIKKFEIINL